MEKQILEVKNYFLNKITACDFQLIKIKKNNGNWHNFKVKIDEIFQFDFSIETKLELFCFHSGFMQFEIPNDRLNNLIKFISNYKIEIKKQEIIELENKLNELKSQIN